MTENSYKYYSVTIDPVISNVQYLQMFAQYDDKFAFKLYRKMMWNDVKLLLILPLVTQAIFVLIVGGLIFPEPLLGFAVIGSYYVARLTYELARPGGFSSAVDAAAYIFLLDVCSYVYGKDDAAALFRSKSDTGQAIPMKPTISLAVMQRMHAIIDKIRRSYSKKTVLLVWLVCSVFFSMFYNLFLVQ